MTIDAGTLYHHSAAEVHETLRRYMLADGLPIVLDPVASRGAWLVDKRTGKRYLDLFSFFASQPLGFNHPRLRDESFREKIDAVASVKVTNSDVYTQAMADFVQTFGDIAIPESHRHHLFFVEGGALAVENAMKAAFDWKYRKNEQKGLAATEDLQILHFKSAFHGRSGYTLSVTNTADPRKYQYFPKFDWPRVSTPGCTGCLACDGSKCQRTGSENDAVVAAEQRSLAEIEAAIASRGHHIAAILIETIQGEGGDNHFRPEFLRALREICDREDMLLIFDEVQTGMGLTGTWWAFQQLGVEPDVFSFGKKSQVCGIAANRRLDEVDSVFKVSSRINSTWGGNLVDMVRAERVVQVIQEEGLLANVEEMGQRLLAGFRKIAADTGKISRVRGRGLMLAFDFADGATRDRFNKALFEREVMMLACGATTMRTRPVLDIDAEAVDVAIERIRDAVESL
ncbi:MAG: L-lysine 6-transaminase [Planctomycetota bacterium]